MIIPLHLKPYHSKFLKRKKGIQRFNRGQLLSFLLVSSEEVFVFDRKYKLTETDMTLKLFLSGGPGSSVHEKSTTWKGMGGDIGPSMNNTFLAFSLTLWS